MKRIFKRAGWPWRTIARGHPALCPPTLSCVIQSVFELFSIIYSFLFEKETATCWTVVAPRSSPSMRFNPESAFEFGKIRTRRTYLPHQYVLLISFAQPFACLIVAAPSYGASSLHLNGYPCVRIAKESISRRKFASLVVAIFPHGVLLRAA